MIFPVGLVIRLWVALLAMFILASYASALDLSGAGGKAVLANLNNTHSTTIKPSDLWTWGTVPLAHSGDNGSLVDSFVIMNPGEDNGTMLTPSQEKGLNEAVETGEISSATAQRIENSGGWGTMNYFDTKPFGATAGGVFDCSCYPVYNAAPFPEPAGSKAW